MRTQQGRKSHPHHVRVKTGQSAVKSRSASGATRELVRSAQIPLEKFDEVLSAFGQLPESAQCELTTRLIRASGSYGLRIFIENQGLPGEREKREQLQKICASAKALLKLLGVSEPEKLALGLGSIPLHSVATTDIVTGLYRIAVERRPLEGAVDAWERLNALFVLLSDLVAITAHVELGPKKPKGRGAKGELIYEIIEIYGELRRRFPNSGPKPGFGGPLKTFVRASSQFAISAAGITRSNGAKYQRADQWAVDRDLASLGRITDGSIRGAFRRWKEVHKSKRNH
jgi:hypothetical protein